MRTHDVARRLRMFRDRHDITQEALARRAHVTAKYVSQIENGHASPTIDTLTRIVEAGLGMPLSAFFAADVSDTRDELARLRALLGGQSPAMRRRALRVVKALVED